MLMVLLAGFASAYHGPHAYLNSATYLLKIVCTVTSDQFNVTNSSTTIHKMNASTSLNQFVCLSTNQDTVAPSLVSSLLSKPSLVLTRVNTMFTRLERTLPTITSIVLAPRRWLV